MYFAFSHDIYRRDKRLFICRTHTYDTQLHDLINVRRETLVHDLSLYKVSERESDLIYFCILLPCETLP
jgi:hypothetical protein